MNAQPKPKRRKCKAPECENWVQVFNSLEPYCSPACGYKVAMVKLEKKRAREQREERASLRKAKAERIATKKAFRQRDRPYQMKLTQAVVNRYVVYVQEAGKGCYTCPTVFNENKLGGVIDCGHWLTRGSRPDRALDTRQMRRQCIPCNRYNSGRPKVFEANLRAELGDDVVDEIRGPSGDEKVTAQDLIDIRAHYARLIREAGLT